MALVVSALSAISAVTAGIAAYYWWASAKVEVPKSLGVSMIMSGDKPFGENPTKSWASDISRLNSKGAMAAAVSAASMCIATVLQLLPLGAP